MIYIIAAILIFGVLIAVHELGHFLAAKACGVRVNEFSIGMGPTILHKTKGDTTYSLRLLPIGGFCAMEGEEEDSNDPTALNNQSFWKKLIIFAAGAFMNFLTGLIIIVVLYAGAKAFYVPVITDFADGCPLQSESGLQVGDRLVSIDGERVYVYSDVSLLLGRNKTGVFDLKVKRDGQTVTLKDFPMERAEYTDQQGQTYTGVVGMEEGIFPGSSAMYDEEELEEERRLCYVAMTRAREKLVMTNARQRMLYGRTSANKSSRFLDEIPAEDMRWESKPEPKFGTYDEAGFGGSRWDDGFGGSSFGGSSYGGFGGQRSAGQTSYAASGSSYGGANRSGSAGRSGGYVSGGVHTYKNAKPAGQPLRTSSRGSTQASPAVELIQLHQGDQVEHTAFGKGTVLSVKPMGGDALAEVAFDGGTTKKLMLKAAGKHMKKL